MSHSVSSCQRSVAQSCCLEKTRSSRWSGGGQVFIALVASDSVRCSSVWRCSRNVTLRFGPWLSSFACIVVSSALKGASFRMETVVPKSKKFARARVRGRREGTFQTTATRFPYRTQHFYITQHFHITQHPFSSPLSAVAFYITQHPFSSPLSAAACAAIASCAPCPICMISCCWAIVAFKKR